MKKDIISSILIYEKIKKDQEKKHQPLQLEIPFYEEINMPKRQFICEKKTYRIKL